MYQEGPLQVSECLHPYLASGIAAQPSNTCKRGIQCKAHREIVTSPLHQPRVKSLMKVKHSLGKKIGKKTPQKNYTCSRPQAGNLLSGPEASWQLTLAKDTFRDLSQVLFQLQQTLKTTSACSLQLVLGSSTFLNAAIILEVSLLSFIARGRLYPVAKDTSSWTTAFGNLLRFSSLLSLDGVAPLPRSCRWWPLACARCA